MINKEPEEKI